MQTGREHRKKQPNSEDTITIKNKNSTSVEKLEFIYRKRDLETASIVDRS